jgi:MFS transporter, putative metabolite:H+ symporter
MITTAIFALGGLASAFATGFASMIVLRMLQGLGLGAEVPVAAAYINEIAPANKRGSFVLLYEFIFAVGIVVAGFVGRWAIPNWGWQSLFLIGSIPPLIALFFMRMLPESPRWLARRERTAEAEGRFPRSNARSRRPARQSARQSRSWHRVERDRARGPNCSALSIANRTLLIWTIWITVGFISWPLTIWLPTIYRNVFKAPRNAPANQIRRMKLSIQRAQTRHAIRPTVWVISV